MSDMVSRFDSSTLYGALCREATALNNTAKATNDTAHNLAAEQTIAGRPRNTFQDIYYSWMGSEVNGCIENDVRYYIRGAGAPVDSQVKTHLSLLGHASFFPVQDSNGNKFFTRVGSFHQNANNIMQNHFGMQLLYSPAVNGVIPETPGSLIPLDMSNLTSAASGTREIIFRCGLSGNVGDSVARAITVHDSLGTPRTLNYVFQRNADWQPGSQSWNLRLQCPYDSTINEPYLTGIPINFNANGTPLTFNGADTPPNLSVTCPGGASIATGMNLGTVGQSNGVILISGGQSRLQVIVDGHSSGAFKSLDIGENGMIYANFDNGQQQLIGRLTAGMFNNPDGLERLPNGLYLPDINYSGNVFYNYIGTTQAGNVAVGALESSTVETIPQMAKMIERQQQFNNISSAYSTTKNMLEKIAHLHHHS